MNNSNLLISIATFKEAENITNLIKRIRGEYPITKINNLTKTLVYFALIVYRKNDANVKKNINWHKYRIRHRLFFYSVL